MAKNKKKVTSAIIAGAAAALLLLGGTFAWQSISQMALNEAKAVANPGGRLHDDLVFTNAATTDNDIYVENFAEDDIFARVRLSEYFERTMNHGTAAELSEIISGSKTLKDPPGDTDASGKNLYDYEYTVHYFDGGNATDAYWTWEMGEGESGVYYMPTFNKNKDSLEADLNGLYVDRVGGISNRSASQYEDYVSYDAGSIETAYAIYDMDPNREDELALAGEDINGLIETGAIPSAYGENVTAVNETHYAGRVGSTKGLISMYDWLEMVRGLGYYDETEHGKYWVYDSDGWVYWSSPIAGGETTGLLLDSFTLNQVMDETWYYAIDVEA